MSDLVFRAFVEQVATASPITCDFGDGEMNACRFCGRAWVSSDFASALVDPDPGSSPLGHPVHAEDCLWVVANQILVAHPGSYDQGTGSLSDALRERDNAVWERDLHVSEGLRVEGLLVAARERLAAIEQHVRQAVAIPAHDRNLIESLARLPEVGVSESSFGERGGKPGGGASSPGAGSVSRGVPSVRLDSLTFEEGDRCVECHHWFWTVDECWHSLVPRGFTGVFRDVRCPSHPGGGR